MSQLIGRIPGDIARREPPADKVQVLEALAVLSAACPGAVPIETAKEWCFEITDKNRRGAGLTASDIMKGARSVGQSAEKPSLVKLLAAINHAKAARMPAHEKSFTGWKSKYLDEGHGGTWACKHAEKPGQVCRDCQRGRA